jgi:hypothetical protein
VGASSGTVRIHCHFNILALLVADFISADYPYLRQITECAADLVIGSLERRFLRRVRHRLHSTIRQEMLAAVRSAAESAQIRDCEGLS